MRFPSVTTLVGNEFDGGKYKEDKFSDSVRGADDCIYGIPFNARRVVKFNPVDKSLKEIGPDLGLVDGRGTVGYWLEMVIFIVFLTSPMRCLKLMPSMKL